MTNDRRRGGIAPPPPGFLGARAAAPRATTLLPEIRSDAGLRLDEDDPALLTGPDMPPSLILWRVELSWRTAQEVQLWLTGAPADGRAATREAALRDFIERQMQAGDPASPFLGYRGAFLSAETSHAHYTFLLEMRRLVPWAEYQAAWPAAVDSLGPPTDPWRQELTWFLRQTVGQATSNVELLKPAAGIGDLRGTGAGGAARYPVIRLLLD